ncbi:5'-nucleotidase C-terminal domain-containing protein [Serratia ureilytica]
MHVQDTGISALFQQAARHYAPLAQVIALQIDNDRAKLDVGDIKAKDIAFNYQYAGGEITVYQLNGKALKRYMGGPPTISISCSRATSPTALTRRGDRPNIPPTISSTASHTIDLRQPAGSRIVDLRLTNGAGHRRYADPSGHEQLPHGPPDARVARWRAILPGAVRQQSAIR